MKLTEEDIKRMIDYDRFSNDRFSNNFGRSFHMIFNHLGEPFVTKYCYLYLNLCESDQCLDGDLKSTFYKKIKRPLFNKLGFLR